MTPEEIDLSIAVFEQQRHEWLSDLTKRGLAEARAMGKRLGRPPGTPQEIVLRLQQMRGSGLTFKAMADELNREQVPTAFGGAMWYPSTVRRLALGVR